MASREIRIALRQADADDATHLLDVFRDGIQSLKESNGGKHPDAEIESWKKKPDKDLLSHICDGSFVLVAQDGRGAVVGMGAITIDIVAGLTGSSYSHAFFVRRSHQGQGVGRLLRDGCIAEARRRGYRKMYGYTYPESIGFHKRFGAVFYPEFDTGEGKRGDMVHYYEIPLRPSIFNGMMIEPYMQPAAWVWVSVKRWMDRALAALIKRG
ncbi:MAG: GNAT family N-acetyltransferase [Candidatus Micrarchaeota archaeon]